MHTRRTLLVLALALAAGAVAQADSKKQHRYVGIHPIAKDAGGGFCYIEGPHVHIYEADKLQYRTNASVNASFFVGDPVAYGYDGPKKAYKGHHPIHVHTVVGVPEPDIEYCYLDGAHFHAFAAPPIPEMKVAGDAYFYVGAPPPVYVEARPMYIGINAIYTPLVYTRPVVVVEPPVGWIGVSVGGPAVVVRPGAAVIAPGVRVRGGVGVGVGVGVHVAVPPPPSISVGVGVRVGGGVMVNGGGKVKVKKGKR